MMKKRVAVRVIGVNCEVLHSPKCFPAVPSNFQMLPSPASHREQINTVFKACKLTVADVEKLQATQIELLTLALTPQIDDSDSTSEYSDDDDVAGRGRSEPETKPILSVRECYSI